MTSSGESLASTFSQHKFDYIVVGGGTSGLALATLLSNDPAVTVGVIEAGQDKEDDVIRFPGLIGQALGKPEYDWGFSTTNQEHANGRQVPMFRGKVLGGTAALNYMAFTRGSHVEHDGWQSLGISGWGWERIKSAIDSCERWSPPLPDIAQKYHANNDPENHGREGYIKTSTHTFYYDIALPLFETMNALGVPTNLAAGSGNPIGIWTETASIDPTTRTRSYSKNAYFEPNRARKNLVVLTGAHATRVVLSSEQDAKGDRKAEGVEYQVGSETFTAKALQEVILSAGSIQTPQLLELSGIGDPNVLRRFNIPLKIDLPGVGENLQDHVSVSIGAVLSGDHVTIEDMNDPSFAKKQSELYSDSKTGMLAATPSTFVFLSARDFIPDNVFTPMVAALDKALSAQDIQESPWKKVYELQRSWLTENGVAQLEIVLFPAYFGEARSQEKDARHYSLSVFLQHSWSRGNVHLTSSSPLDPPAIDLGLLNSPADIDTVMMVQAVKYAFKIMQTGALGAETLRIVDPLPTSSDAELAEYVRQHTTSAWHPIGTASMLPRENNGVVNDSLKVYGTSNLRVVDASIIPIHIGTHPQSLLYGMAHIAANEIAKTTNS